MDAIRVNGAEIAPDLIAAEAQNHPAATPDRALEAGARALVIRELLLQRACQLGLKPDPVIDGDNRRETDEEALIRQLLDREVSIPEADDAACRRYYDNNRHRFHSPDLFEAAHILIAADPADEKAYAAATEMASSIITTLAGDPAAFSALARTHSDCTSAAQGGILGQITKGQTVPEFETFLFNLEEDQICPVPVKSRYGVHVLRLDRRIPGRDLPFEKVRDRIAEYLSEASWRRAVSQYIRILVGQADIRGFVIDGADSPLIQ